jgi:hypothetical protein
MKANVLLDKNFVFAIRIVNAYKFLVEEKKEYVCLINIDRREC